jgi:hypothetical protein
MQDDTFLAFVENRRRLFALLRKRQAGSDALNELSLRIKRSRLAIARSRLLLSQPVITLKNIGASPHRLDEARALPKIGDDD